MSEANEAAASAAGEEPVEVAEEVSAGAEQIEQDESEQPEEGQAEDELEEIEIDGAKHRVAKALKDAFMRTADYTKKTQEVAEHRKALEARQSELSQQAEVTQALRTDYGKVHALELQLASFDDITPQQWGQMYAEDPGSAKALEIQQAQLGRSLADARRELETKEQTLTQQQRDNTAKQARETWATLSKDIPGWNEPVARQVVDFAEKEFGVSLEELRTSDARTWKVLHRLQSAEADLKALKSKQKTAERQEKVAGIEPARTVGGKATGYKPGLSDDLPTDEWVRRRNAEEARARAAKSPLRR